MMSIFWPAPFKNPTWSGPSAARIAHDAQLTGIYDKGRPCFSSRSAAWALDRHALVFAAFCFAVWQFFRTRWASRRAALRRAFARAAGISDERTRVQASVLSTSLAAIGIVVFSQSYGFVQLYTAPLLMAFPAIACILIGGATVGRATIAHVVIGTFLFQSILTTALPVTSQVIQGDISETARLIIQNGMILYALTRVAGRS
jgi:simple sugar transport system permease protein